MARGPPGGASRIPIPHQGPLPPRGPPGGGSGIPVRPQGPLPPRGPPGGGSGIPGRPQGPLPPRGPPGSGAGIPVRPQGPLLPRGPPGGGSGIPVRPQGPLPPRGPPGGGPGLLIPPRGHLPPRGSPGGGPGIPIRPQGPLPPRGPPGGGSGIPIRPRGPLPPQQHPVAHRQQGPGFHAPMGPRQNFQGWGGPGQGNRGPSEPVAISQQGPSGPQVGVRQNAEGPGQSEQSVWSHLGEDGGNGKKDNARGTCGRGLSVAMWQAEERCLKMVGGDDEDIRDASIMSSGSVCNLSDSSPPPQGYALADYPSPEGVREAEELQNNMRRELRRKKRKRKKLRILEQTLAKARQLEVRSTEPGTEESNKQKGGSALAPGNGSLCPSHVGPQAAGLRSGEDAPVKATPPPTERTASAVAAGTSSICQRLPPIPLAKVAWSVADIAARFPGLVVPESLTHAIASWVALDTRGIGVVPMMCQPVLDSNKALGEAMDGGQKRDERNGAKSNEDGHIEVLHEHDQDDGNDH
ncbi:unnamed protein product, partial [Sphacelaria rigidula]